MTRNEFEEMQMKALISGSISGIIFGIALIIIMFATGSTFGQRCATKYEKNSLQWTQCIEDLSDGKNIGI